MAQNTGVDGSKHRGLEDEVRQLTVQSGLSRVRKWLVEGAKVACRGCESGTLRVWKWHFEGVEVAL